jgi:hypothetical protein
MRETREKIKKICWSVDERGTNKDWKREGKRDDKAREL